MNNKRDAKVRRPQWLITGARVGLIAATMAISLSMITFAQTTRPTIESTPTAVRELVSSDSLKHDKKSTERDTSVQTDPPVSPVTSTAVKVEIQRHVNNLRREQLDNRAAYIDYWLAAIAIVLTFFGIVIALASYIGFGRFREIEAEGKKNVTATAGHVEDAERLVDQIKKNRDETDKIRQDMTAQTVADDPEEAMKAATNVDENPMASLIDKAIAQAVLLQQQDKRDETIEKWRAVAHIAEEIDNNQAARAWFSVGYLLENPEDSILAYDQAISLKPDYADAYYNRGVVKDELGQREDAIADYDEAIGLKPDFAESYNNRGNAKAALGQHDEAIADYDEAIRLKPDFAESYNNRGTARGKLGQGEDAIADYNEATRLKPDFVEAYYNRGSMKAELGQIADAITDYDEATRLKPDYAEAYNNRGIEKAELGQIADAIADYDEAIRLKPDFRETYNNRGNAKGALGQYDDAIADYDEAIRLKPDYAEAYNNRGIMKAALGRNDEARQDLEIGLELAQDANDTDLVDEVKQLLRDLDADDT